MIMRKYRTGSHSLLVPSQVHSLHLLPQGTPKVFNAMRRPWVDINAAEALEIVRVINTCPSMACAIPFLRDHDSTGSWRRAQLAEGSEEALRSSLGDDAVSSGIFGHVELRSARAMMFSAVRFSPVSSRQSAMPQQMV